MASGKDLATVVLILWLGRHWAEAAERTKRELKFPKGASFVAAVALVSFLPKGITEGLAHILEFDLGFPFPDKMAFERGTVQNKKALHKIYKKYREKRSAKDEERENILLRIEDAITRIGHDGPGCVSRFRCELQHVSPETSLLEKLLVSLFKTSSKFSDGDCKRFASACPISLLQVILHSQQIQ